MSISLFLDGENPIAARFGMYLVLVVTAFGIFAWSAQSMLRPSFRRMRRYFRHRQRR